MRVNRYFVELLWNFGLNSKIPAPLLERQTGIQSATPIARIGYAKVMITFGTIAIYKPILIKSYYENVQ